MAKIKQNKKEKTWNYNYFNYIYFNFDLES